MKVVINIPNVYYEEKQCGDFLGCLEVYMSYLVEYGSQLGLCYGNNYLGKFPIAGKHRNECTNGYVEIV